MAAPGRLTVPEAGLDRVADVLPITVLAEH